MQIAQFTYARLKRPTRNNVESYVRQAEYKCGSKLEQDWGRVLSNNVKFLGSIVPVAQFNPCTQL